MNKVLESTRKRATGRILITKVPAGEAPVWVRTAWADLILPCYPICGYPRPLLGEGEFGALTGDLLPSRRSFAVPQDLALLVLDNMRPKAAKWWREHGFPKAPPYHCFGFGEDEAEIISGVEMQSVIEVTDEMQGDPDR